MNETDDQILDRVDEAWLRRIVERVDGPEGWRYPRLSAAVEELREERREEHADDAADREVAIDDAYSNGYTAGYANGCYDRTNGLDQ